MAVKIYYLQNIEYFEKVKKWMTNEWRGVVIENVFSFMLFLASGQADQSQDRYYPKKIMNANLHEKGYHCIN